MSWCLCMYNQYMVIFLVCRKSRSACRLTRLRLSCWWWRRRSPRRRKAPRARVRRVTMRTILQTNVSTCSDFKNNLFCFCLIFSIQVYTMSFITIRVLQRFLKWTHSYFSNAWKILSIFNYHFLNLRDRKKISSDWNICLWVCEVRNIQPYCISSISYLYNYSGEYLWKMCLFHHWNYTYGRIWFEFYKMPSYWPLILFNWGVK